MRELDALGFAGGPRGVDDGRHLVRRGLVQLGPEVALGQPVAVCQGLQRQHPVTEGRQGIVEGDDRRRPIHVGDGLPGRGLLIGAPDEEHANSGVVEDVTQLGGGVGGVHRHRRAAQHLHREVRHGPFGTVLGEDGRPIPGGESAITKPAGQGAKPPAEIGEAELQPPIVPLTARRHTVAAAFTGIEDHQPEVSDLHGTPLRPIDASSGL
jgi:hypothetical protein